jgi:hypothetical protein
LIDPKGGDVTELNGAALMVQHAAFHENPLVRDVHLVRAPTPGSRQRDQRERPGEDYAQEQLVFVHEMNVLATEYDQGDHHDRNQHWSADATRHGRHRDDPDFAFSEHGSRRHTYKRKDSTAKNQNIASESPVNFAAHTLRI